MKFKGLYIHIIVILCAFLLASCGNPKVVMPTPDSAKAGAETMHPVATPEALETAPASVGSSQRVNPKNHRLPDPEVIIIVGKKANVELMPGTEEYNFVLGCMRERVQRELGMTSVYVPDDDPELEGLLAETLSVVFEYSSLVEEMYSFDGFEMSVGFTRLLMPLEQAGSIEDAVELMYFGDELQFFSEPARIDPPTEDLVNMARQATGEE